MRTMGVVGLVLALAVVLALCGCGGNDNVIVPNAYQGTWTAEALTSTGGLLGVGTFTVSSDGVVHGQSGNFFASGNVSGLGVFTAQGTSTTFTAQSTGTLTPNDTGTGTFNRYQNGTVVSTGTIVMWRANGGLYAGTWDVNVTGGASGSGVATVDTNGIITGSATVAGVVTTLSGVVTGTGTVVVAWTVNTVTALANGPANGTITGSVAGGSWQDDTGGSGTWTATKQ